MKIQDLSSVQNYGGEGVGGGGWGGREVKGKGGQNCGPKEKLRSLAVNTKVRFEMFHFHSRLAPLCCSEKIPNFV